MADKHDWLSDISARTRQAHKPDPFASILQSFKQGFVGKKIAQDELRKAVMTAMLGTHTPMVGETPATPEQVAAGIKGKPGFIASLFGAKSPEELTWKPLSTEWKPKTKEEKLEVIRAGKESPYQAGQLKIDIERLEMEKEVAKSKGAKAKVDYAFNFVKTFAAYEDKDLKEKGLLVEMSNQRNYLAKISSLQRYADDVDSYYDRMLELANGNQAEAMRMTGIFMQRLGISQEMIEPYMRER